MDKFMDNKMIDDKDLEQINGGQIEPPTPDECADVHSKKDPRRHRLNNTSDKKESV